MIEAPLRRLRVRVDYSGSSSWAGHHARLQKTKQPKDIVRGQRLPPVRHDEFVPNSCKNAPVVAHCLKNFFGVQRELIAQGKIGFRNVSSFSFL